LTYGLEVGYLCLSLIAWRTLSNTNYDDYCSSEGGQHQYSEENF
jgi:hypothetical protein